jgi:hypothetical protein
MIEGSKEERKEGSAGRKEGRDGRKDLCGRALVAPCVREGRRKEGRKGERKEGKEWRGGECWKELWWNCGSSAYYPCYAPPEATSALPSDIPFSNFGFEKDLIRRHFVLIGRAGL